MELERAQNKIKSQKYHNKLSKMYNVKDKSKPDACKLCMIQLVNITQVAYSRKAVELKLQ